MGWEEERAQISAELIIIMAAILAVALIVVSQLQSTARGGTEKVGNKTEELWEKIDET